MYQHITILLMTIANTLLLLGVIYLVYLYNEKRQLVDELIVEHSLDIEHKNNVIDMLDNQVHDQQTKIHELMQDLAYATSNLQMVLVDDTFTSMTTDLKSIGVMPADDHPLSS